MEEWESLGEKKKDAQSRVDYSKIQRCLWLKDVSFPSCEYDMVGIEGNKILMCNASDPHLFVRVLLYVLNLSRDVSLCLTVHVTIRLVTSTTHEILGEKFDTRMDLLHHITPTHCEISGFGSLTQQVAYTIGMNNETKYEMFRVI